MSNTNIQITDLDFDTIKTTLKTYLLGQNVFTDYDFDGSALSVLLDVLSYNTHYNAYYANMVANEMFLDSATQRDSIVSIAKHLGYTPHSKVGTSASITLEITESGSMTATSVTIPKYAKFESTVNGNSYTFYTINSYSTTSYNDVSSSRIFTISGIVLKEGTKLNKQFIVNNENLNSEKYVLPNEGIDSSTLVVRIKSSIATSDSGYLTYTKHDGLRDLTSESTIYFLHETENGKYELLFGDNVYGKKLQIGNVISVDYMTTNGSLANGAGGDEELASSTYGFTLVSSNSPWGLDSDSNSVDMSVIAKVSGTYGSIGTGGSEIESEDSIKFIAPLNFQSQNRALTANDYKSIILSKYNNVDSIRVWGGEDNERPEYGKVFVVVKPKNGTLLTEQNIGDIKNIIDDYKPLGITTSVASPEYLYLNIESTVTYNPEKSLETEGTLKSLVISGIKSYNQVNLAKFDSIFRYSQLTALIDDANVSIISNSTDIGVREHKIVREDQFSEVYKDVQANVWRYKDGAAINIIFSDIDLKSSIKPGTFLSDTFITLGNISTESNIDKKTVLYKDDGKGNINLETIAGNIIQSNVGVIDYNTGIVSKLSAVKIESIISLNSYLKFTGDVENQDIYPTNTQIILFEESDIIITMKSEIV